MTVPTGPRANLETVHLRDFSAVRGSKEAMFFSGGSATSPKSLAFSAIINHSAQLQCPFVNGSCQRVTDTGTV